MTIETIKILYKIRLSLIDGDEEYDDIYTNDYQQYIHYVGGFVEWLELIEKSDIPVETLIVNIKKTIDEHQNNKQKAGS